MLPLAFKYECMHVVLTGKEADNVEFLFIEGDDIIVFRSSSAVNLPDPPGCFTFGCTNGMPSTRIQVIDCKLVLRTMK